MTQAIDCIAVRSACGGGSEPWPSWVPESQRRRLDPLTRTACALIADLRTQPGTELPADTGVAVATSYGSVHSTLRFAESLAAHGDGGASPSPFTTSVHNACAATLGECLGVRGPTTTISHGGLSSLAALRWAALMLQAGRAPRLLVVAGDRHNPWTQAVVTDLSASPWPIGDGVTALLLAARPAEAPAPSGSRTLRLGGAGLPPLDGDRAALAVDGGALEADDRAQLAAAAGGRERCIVPDRLGAWWPCCLLCGVPWQADRALLLHEVEAGAMQEIWLGPPAP
jgi:hypothetical protein